MTRIALYQGDITELAVDAIVTAANSALIGGGGVDGAVHDLAGPELLEACRLLAPCPAGEARITPAFNLNCKYIIHAVGPIYGHDQPADALLSGAYNASLRLAVANALRSVAFPCISTGAYGYPAVQACEVAVGTVVQRQNADRTGTGHDEGSSLE
ncbi:O-acetyl-ADP-ribose deacetylase [Rubripirellula obstinata]|uniref:O-acetyl-ADP-ribose deacetylase n=1 Tax=Rubripirellula obstinata TaxID=406547 RepID=A0A5B1CMZ9_9BACT|nr:macro domain-containing protein [Rubripirellula obstinata]KAA1260950.1 O-acetyl-ADP-ribose deacetylase [Rubripirellula obstinata]